MKYIRLFCFPLCIIIVTNSFAQQKKAYANAFKYVEHLYKGKELTVSDTIIHLELSNYLNELSAEWGTKPDIKTVRLLDSIDHAQEKYKLGCIFLKRLSVKGAKPAQAIYFSNMYNDMFIVEVFTKQKNEDMRHGSQSSFNGSIQFLFLFDKKNKIRKVFRKVIQYD